MPRIVTKPFDKQAVKGATDSFYNIHPEMVQNGKRIPLDPCNPKHAAMQSQWMDLYEAYGGNTQRGTMDRKCGECVENCPCSKKSLYVRVAEDTSRGAIFGTANVRVVIQGPETREGMTNDVGEVLFYGVEPGEYFVEAYLEKTGHVQEVAEKEKEIETHRSEIHEITREGGKMWISESHTNPDHPASGKDSIWDNTFVKLLVKALTGAGGGDAYASGAEAFAEQREREIDAETKETQRARQDELEAEVGEHSKRIQELKSEIQEIKTLQSGSSNVTVPACSDASGFVQMSEQSTQ